MLDVAGRDDDALTGAQTAQLAGIEKAFDLFVDPADRLDLAVLIDRPGNREGLFDRRIRQRGEQREELGGGSAVAIDTTVGLLEDEARIERQGSSAAKAAAEKARQDQHALGMERTAEGNLALDIDHLAATQPDLGGDPGGIAKRESAETDHRQAIDLPNPFTPGFEADRLAADLLLHAPVQTVAAVKLRVDRGVDLGGADLLLAGIGRELVGLLQQISDRTQAGRQALLIA